MKKECPRWAVAVFFAALLLLGLFTAGDYGVPWDERDEMDILRMNLWEYTRALGGDEAVFERCAAGFDERLTISALVPISQSIEQDHGICAFYPMAGVVLDEGISEARRSALWHAWCWGIFTLGAFALYGVCRELGLSRAMALLGPMLLLLSPRFFAQGHFNNKDIALMSLTLCVLWQGLRLMRRPTFGSGLCFALFGAMAANTKVAGLALWGLCGLFVVARQVEHRNLNGRVLAIAAATLGAFGAAYALLTPALWAHGGRFLRYLVQNALAFQRWQNQVLFRGAIFETWKQPLPWYYLPYMVVATTPLWILLAIALGTVLALGRIIRRWKDTLPVLLTLCLWALPLGFAVVTRTSVYNGWRHFYFVYGPMLALAVWGLDCVLKRIRARRALACVLAVCMACEGVGLAMQHPRQYAYYEPLVRLRGTDYNELDYWNVSMRDALERLAEETTGEISVAFPELWTENGFAKALAVLPGETAQRFAVREDAQYWISNSTYALFSSEGLPEDMRERMVFSSYGQPILRIFERNLEAKE